MYLLTHWNANLVILICCILEIVILTSGAAIGNVAYLQSFANRCAWFPIFQWIFCRYSRGESSGASPDCWLTSLGISIDVTQRNKARTFWISDSEVFVKCFTSLGILFFKYFLGVWKHIADTSKLYNDCGTTPWKRFPHYPPFWGETHRLPIVSRNKMDIKLSFDFFVSRIDLLNKQVFCQWFEAP